MDTRRPRLLPLLGAPRHGNRDAMTCLYRCGNACDHPVPNASDNPYFQDVAEAEFSRRGVLRTGAVGALVLGFGGAAAHFGIAAGAEYLFIEQDNTYGRDQFAALADSRAALVDLGYEHLL